MKPRISPWILSSLLTAAAPRIAHAQPARPTPPIARPTPPAARPAQPATRPAQPAVRPTPPAAQPVAQPAAQPTPTGPGAAVPSVASQVVNGVDPAAQVTAPPTPPPPPPALQLSISQGINGQFATLACRDDVPPPALSVVAGRLVGAGTLAIDAGDLMGSAAVTRLAMEHDTNGLADAVAATGLRALAVGHRDIAASRATFIAGAEALAARHVPYVLSNLHCEGSASAVCAVVTDAGDQPLILDSPAGRVAMLSFLSPSVLPTIARDRAAGLTLSDPAEAIGPAVAAARTQGARFVVVTLDPTWHSELTEALTLVNALAEDQRPDVFVVNDLPGGMGSVQSEGSNVTVVAARSGDVVTVDLGANRPVRPRVTGEAPAGVQSFVQNTTRWLCETHHRPLPGAHLQHPMELSDFGNLLVDVLRDRTSSEVGIVNRAAVRSPGIFPLRDAITALDVTAAMPFEDTVMVARVKGSVLAALAKSPGASRFILRGITVTEGAVKVNGRPIDENGTYSVVTTGFVTDGGDGGLGDGAPPFRQYGTQSLREMYMAWLSTPRGDDVDITTAPSDPANHTRWRLRWSLDGAFATNSIVNDNVALYTDAQLTRAEASTFRLDTELRADADHPSFTFENGFRIQYGVARTMAGQDFLENLDLTTLRSVFTWRAWRGVTPHFYHPLPYAEAYVETEMDHPATRDWHHTQLRPTAGARFELIPKLTANLGVGVDWEVNDPTRHAEAVLVAAVTLLPRRLFSLGERNIEMQTSLELSYRDPGDRRDLLFRGNLKFAIPIFDVISLTMAYDLFARAVGDNPWALAFDANIGLKITFDRAIQSFSF